MGYFSGERSFFSEVKVIVSSFLGFLLCATSFRFPMQNQNQCPVIETVRSSISGLKALISLEEGKGKEERVIRGVGIGIIRSKLSTNSSSSSFCNSIRSFNFLMDDLIGTESGVCLTSNAGEIEEKVTRSDSDFSNNRVNRRDLLKKEFPPPIPFLEALAGHRIRPPWILTRNCIDGRLILNLERVRHHQSLESHRENGRLILNLVPANVAGVGTEDEDDQDLQFIEDAEEEEKIKESVECEEGDDPEYGFKSFPFGGGGGGGRMVCDRGPFCGVNGNLGERHVVHGHFGSAPLRSMGTVM